MIRLIAPIVAYMWLVAFLGNYLPNLWMKEWWGLPAFMTVVVGAFGVLFYSVNEVAR